jgi:ankyrin repeat protein
MHVRTSGSFAWWIVLLLATLHAGSGADLRLVEAVKKHDVAAIRALLKDRVDVNVRQGDGATALHWAVHGDDLETTDLLIRAGAPVNAADDLGVTPLSLACANGSGTLVERLLKAGANPNAVMSTGESPLMSAARTGSIGAVKTLVAHGADVNATETSHGQTALMWAVAHQHPDVVKSLIEMRADIHARSYTRRRGLLLGNRYLAYDDTRDVKEVEEGGYTALLFAARQGDVSSARLLLEAGANVNESTPDGTSALVLAAHGGRGAFAGFLLDKGADPNAAGSGYAALHAAVLRGDLALAKALLAHGADPDVPLTKGTPVRRYSQDYALNAALIGATPFWLAARYGDVEMMRVLAAGDADPRFAMPDGTTALMAAIAAGPGFGGGAGDRRERYLSPVELAARIEGADARVTFETAKVAVDLGADVNGIDAAGDASLHMAASQGLTAVVQLLLDKGAHVNAANHAGDTALHNAAARGRHAVIHALVSKGAALDLKNKNGQTALGLTAAVRTRGAANLASESEASRKETADLLRQLGAKE